MALRAQLRHYLGWYTTSMVAIATCSLTIWYLHTYRAVEVTEMFEDPVALAGFPLYVGVFTYLGASLLLVSGSLLLFVALAVPHLGARAKAFLALLGALVLWFGFDDVFMVHEWIGLRLAWLGGSENAGYDRQWLESCVFGAYAIAWAGLMVAFWRQLAQTAWILLGLALTSFGVSACLDVVSFIPFVPEPTTRSQRTLLAVAEDLAKLAGSLFMLAYAVHTSRDVVRGSFWQIATGSWRKSAPQYSE